MRLIPVVLLNSSGELQSFFNHLADENIMKRYQDTTDRYAVLIKVVTRKNNAVYGSYDNRRRFNMRAQTMDKFENKCQLDNHNAAVQLHDVRVRVLAAQTVVNGAHLFDRCERLRDALTIEPWSQ